MKKFAFKLEAALSLKKHKEKMVMQEIGVLNTEKERAEHGVKTLLEEETALKQARQKLLEKGVNGARILASQGYEKRLSKGRQELFAHIETVKGHLDVKKGELAACALERKTVESLKERQKERFLKESLKSQIKEDDEASLIHRAARSQRS